MNIIICGAGEVGFTIARHLALENNAVTVVDRSPELVRRVNDTLDAQGVVGHGAHPDTLKRAGAEDADMIIAVTYTDEINMVACQVAHSLFDIPTKIARIRHQSYLQPIWANLFSRDHLPIDVIISPEVEVARAVTRRLKVPGAFEMIPLVDDKVRLLGVRCEDNCPVINTSIKQLDQLFPDLKMVVVGVNRNEQAVPLSGETEMLVGDDVYFVAETEQVPRCMAAFGHEESAARRMLICGGGNIALLLAQAIEREYPWINAKVIERDPDRAALVASLLDRTVVLQGDVLDPEILEEADVDSTDTVVAVTNDDEANILSAMLAKRHGAKRAICLLNKGIYNPLIGTLGLDVVVSPRNITVSTILQHVRRGRIYSVHTLREGFGELIEAEALETSGLVGQPLRDADLPDGVMIGALVRGGRVISPRGGTVIRAGDRVVLFADPGSVRRVEKLFSVRLEYF
ncbi:MAG: Trk system potassium transporter TrkA [Rhodospirillales bacterium]|nr:MAG: Trk system potassium transporter TrkA [Rhodospirillales bacterium]